MSEPSVVRQIIRLLNRLRIRYMIVGGLAAEFYGSMRATQDADVALALDPGGLERLLSAFRHARYRFSDPEARLLSRLGNRFYVFAPNAPYRVDFWQPQHEFERKTLVRRRQANILGLSTWIIAPEDLILLKLQVDRVKDQQDVESVLAVMEKRLDWRYLRHWVAALGLTGRFTTRWGRAQRILRARRPARRGVIG